MSVDNAKFGILLFILSTRFRYCSFVYFLFIAFNTFVLPDCSGKCTNLHTLSHVAIASITSSVKSFGCGDIKRILSICSILFTAFNNVANEFIPSYSSNGMFFSRSTLKYEFTF